MLRFLVEGYDGLLFLRTVEPHGAVVAVSWSPAAQAEAQAVFVALARECHPFGFIRRENN